MLREEVAHGCTDLVGVGLQGEVATIDETYLSVRDVPFEGLGARGDEERIVLAPDRQHRRPLVPQIGLYVAVKGNVGLVVAEQVQLDLVVARTRQVKIVEVAAIGRDQRRVGHAVGVLEQRGLRGQEAAQGVTVGLARLVPVGLDRSEGVGHAFQVSVAVLRDDRGDTVGMGQRQAEADRGAVVEDVDGEAL